MKSFGVDAEWIPGEERCHWGETTAMKPSPNHPSMDVLAYMMAIEDGSFDIDHVWGKCLQRALLETARCSSLEDALRPLTSYFPEINAGDLQAAVDGQRMIWRTELYDPAGDFKLPKSYLVDWAACIYAYTLSNPKVFKVVNREMFSPDRRSSGGGVSDGLRACLPYIRFLIDALKALPARFRFKGQVYRGVKHCYPTPENHDPVRHFRVGKRLRWDEFKSTTKEQGVITGPHFCGMGAGPRTKFTIDVTEGYDISLFSAFQGVNSEHEVLLLPLSYFVVVHAARNIIDPKETVNLQRSGYPDTVHLRQVEASEPSAKFWSFLPNFGQSGQPQQAQAPSSQPQPPYSAPQQQYFAPQHTLAAIRHPQRLGTSPLE